jgi:hypothetical protein
MRKAIIGSAVLAVALSGGLTAASAADVTPCTIQTYDYSKTFDDQDCQPPVNSNAVDADSWGSWVETQFQWAWDAANYWKTQADLREHQLAKRHHKIQHQRKVIRHLRAEIRRLRAAQN